MAFQMNHIQIDGSAQISGSLIMTDPSAQLGFFGADPSTRSMGWDASQGIGDKAYVVTATNINELADIVGTLINELKSKGLLGGF